MDAWIAPLAAVLGALGIGCLWTYWRLRAARSKVASQTAVERIDTAPRFCPLCDTDYPPGTAFCVKDGSELLRQPLGSRGLICPVCKRGFPHDARFCPHDAEELIPYGQYTAQKIVPSYPPPLAAKICPHCGLGYADRQSFCGADGAELIIVN